MIREPRSDNSMALLDNNVLIRLVPVARRIVVQPALVCLDLFVHSDGCRP